MLREWVRAYRNTVYNNNQDKYVIYAAAPNATRCHSDHRQPSFVLIVIAQVSRYYFGFMRSLDVLNIYHTHATGAYYYNRCTVRLRLGKKWTNLYLRRYIGKPRILCISRFTNKSADYIIASPYELIWLNRDGQSPKSCDELDIVIDIFSYTRFKLLSKLFWYLLEQSQKLSSKLIELVLESIYSIIYNYIHIFCMDKFE